MKNLSDFDAFKMNKVQMNGLKGGAVTYTCSIHYLDDLGGDLTMDVTIDDSVKLGKKEVEGQLSQQTGGSVSCTAK